jgi:hypothetical protein
MKEMGFPASQTGDRPNSSPNISQKIFSLINILLVAAFVADLLTPFLIWKGFLPSFTRWISSAVIIVVITILFFQMIVSSRIPVVILIIASLSLIGITVALFNNQDALATLWGWWLLFKYPLVGIFVYVQPSVSERFPERLRKVCLALLMFEVFFQLVQYLMGEHPGDDLVGTFGYHATQPLLSFTIFALCLASGQWIASRQWKNLVWVMILCAISGVLSETKFFLPASFLVIGLSVLIAVAQSGKLLKSMPIILLIGVSLLLFIIGYDTYVPGADRVPIENYILDPGSFGSYANMEYRTQESGAYYMGRTRAVLYGWDTITSDPVTLVFGMGIGARGESRSLGVTGVAFNGTAGMYTRTSSLLVFMQEMGLLGLIAIIVFMFWIVTSQLDAIKRNPQSPRSELRYALVLFSLLWPLWMYYATVWNQEVVMMLYWASLGYVCRQENQIQDTISLS